MIALNPLIEWSQRVCFDNRNRVIIHYVHAQSGCSATGGAKDVYTTYNGLGRITSKRFSSFGGTSVTYAYDGLGRVTSTTDINGRTLNYQYNLAGARTRMQFPDGVNIDYALDNASRLKSFGWNDNWSVYAQGFNNLGERAWEAKGGVGGVTYTYDGIGRLATMTDDLNGTTNDITWGPSYNPTGQMITTTSSTDVYDYEELTGIAEPSQSHDGLNRVSTLVGATGACPLGGYDARGNLICDGTGRSYTYDIENRLLSGNLSGNNLNLTYDPEGRMSTYNWNGGVTSFLYDGVNLIGEYNNSSQMLRRYVHGPGTDNPVVWYEGSSNATLRYFYTNQQGSVITTSDSGGNRGDIYAYGAYGEPKDQYGFTYWPSIGTGGTNVSRFGYTGQVFLADARLYHYKSRVYDPQLGRFLQTDPIGSADDMNVYAYVGGDPINNIDPMGLATIDNVGFTIWGSRCGGSCISGEAMNWLSFAAGGERGFGSRHLEEATRAARNSGGEVVIRNKKRPLRLAAPSLKTISTDNTHIGLDGVPYEFREDATPKEGDSQECLDARNDLANAAVQLGVAGLAALAGRNLYRDAVKRNTKIGLLGPLIIAGGDLYAIMALMTAQGKVDRYCNS